MLLNFPLDKKCRALDDVSSEYLVQLEAVTSLVPDLVLPDPLPVTKLSFMTMVGNEGLTTNADNAAAKVACYAVYQALAPAEQAKVAAAEHLDPESFLTDITYAPSYTAVLAAAKLHNKALSHRKRYVGELVPASQTAAYRVTVTGLDLPASIRLADLPLPLADVSFSVTDGQTLAQVTRLATAMASSAYLWDKLSPAQQTQIQAAGFEQFDNFCTGLTTEPPLETLFADATQRFAQAQSQQLNLVNDFPPPGLYLPIE